MSTIKPNQALFLWRMITGRSADVRQPALSKAKPELGKDRQTLIEKGYLRLETKGRTKHLALTEKAWAWAQEEQSVELLKSPSPLGAEALQDLLHSLLPYLSSRKIPLTALFTDLQAAPLTESDVQGEQSSFPSPPKTLPGLGAAPDPREMIKQAYLALSEGKLQVPILLSNLRPLLPHLERDSLDQELLEMECIGQIALQPHNDVTSLTPTDHNSALLIGTIAHHIVTLQR